MLFLENSVNKNPGPETCHPLKPFHQKDYSHYISRLYVLNMRFSFQIIRDSLPFPDAIKKAHLSRFEKDKPFLLFLTPLRVFLTQIGNFPFRASVAVSYWDYWDHPALGDRDDGDVF